MIYTYIIFFFFLVWRVVFRVEGKDVLNIFLTVEMIDNSLFIHFFLNVLNNM